MISDQFKGTTLLFNKPIHWTSFDVVNKVKRLLHVKIGHAGTLDPLASGLLILCTGTFTKKISEFQLLDKEYTGTFTLGVTTPSFDAETEVNEQFDIKHITEPMIIETAKNFVGEIDQAPPIHSAKHHEGTRYYELARKDQLFEVKKQLVTLFEFEITKIDLPLVHFRIACGKGFYVRSLANDFGKALNAGAFLSSLCRTRIGEYRLNDAWQIEDFTKFVREQKEKVNTV